jgi:cation:H+ antiporter
LGAFDAIVLITITFYFGYKLFRKKAKSSATPEIQSDEFSHVSNLQAGAYLGLGLALLVLSAEALVAAATSIAGALDVSTAIIGLTVVALGTSLPELAASVTCVLKGHHDLAIGNIVGSNILNLLAVLPFPGLLSPGSVEAALLYRDYTTVLLLTLLLALVCYRGIKKNSTISRLNGIGLLSIYCGWFTVMMFQLNS